MTHRQIYTKKAPKPGNYSQGRLVDLGDYYVLHTCGQTGDNPKTGEVVEGGIETQTRQALENIKTIVEEAGGGLEHIAKVTVMIKDMAANKQGFESVYTQYFPRNKTPPARSMFEAVEIPLPGDAAIVEIEAIVYIPKPYTGLTDVEMEHKKI